MGPRQPNKRSKGEGSVYLVTRGGKRYVMAQLDVGRYPNGKRKYARKLFPVRPSGKTKAQDWLRDQRGEAVTETRSLGDYLTMWLTTVKGSEVLQGIISQRTLSRYLSVARQQIIPAIGHVRMDRVTGEHCQRLLDDLAKQGLSASSRNLVHSILTMVFKYATHHKAVPSNPMTLIRTAPADPPADADALTEDEASRVRDVITGDRLEALGSILLTYGVRKGELGHMRWSWVDWDLQQITIPAWARKNKKQLVLPLVNGIPELLRAHKARQTREREALPVWLGDDYLFTKTDGLPICGRDNRSREINRVWNKWLAEARVKHICPSGCKPEKPCDQSLRRVHAARHGAGLFLLDHEMPLEIVATILGHNIDVCARVYARARPALVKQHLDRIYAT